MNKITTRTIEAFLDENGILRIKILDGVNIDLGDAIDNYLVLRNLSAGQRRLKLIDAKGHWIITKEAQKFSLRDDTPEKTIAKAVLVKGVMDIIIKTLRLKRKSQVPIRFFILEKNALKWLAHFKENN